MKNSNKWIASAVTAVAIFFAVNVNAQTISPKKIRFGVGAEGGIVTGDAHNFSNLELGGTARVQYGLSPKVALTLTSGYYNFFGKTVPGLNEKYQSLGMVPIKLGAKYFVSQNIYLAGEAGVGIETKTFAYQGEPDNLSSQTHTKLLLSPGIGYASKHWDVGVRYENYSGQSTNYGLVALRLAYGFGL